MECFTASALAVRAAAAAPCIAQSATMAHKETPENLVKPLKPSQELSRIIEKREMFLFSFQEAMGSSGQKWKRSSLF